MLDISLAVGFLTLLGPSGGPAGARPAAPGVRPLTAQAAALVAAGRAQSPTVSALLDQLSRSDVVVYVRFSLALRPPRARTTLVNASGHLRYLAITMSLPNPIAIEMLGHELAHAVEIASNPHIRSQADLAAFYRSVGRNSTGRRGFDTGWAIAIQHKVRSELGRSGSSNGDRG